MPHVRIRYRAHRSPEPLEELQLFYGKSYWNQSTLHSYWEDHQKFQQRATHVRRLHSCALLPSPPDPSVRHQATAPRAPCTVQVIAALLAALEAAGVPRERLEAQCLAAVDLRSADHRRYRQAARGTA